MQLRLKGKTLKGKNVLRRCGEVWEVVEERESVACLNGDVGILIKPLAATDDLRWIRRQNDLNFDVTVI